MIVASSENWPAFAWRSAKLRDIGRPCEFRA
jgi:hypothetical protein